MVDRGSTFIDAFVFVLKDIHIDRWDWWMGAAWNCYYKPGGDTDGFD